MTVKLNWRGAELQKRLEHAQMTAIDQTTASCDAGAKGLLNKSQGGGRMYHKGKTIDTVYQASAPGEPPVKVTGILQGSISSRPAVRRGKHVVGEWGSYNNAYALWLEIGTGRMQKRPYLRPTAQEQYPKLAGRIKKAFAGSGT